DITGERPRTEVDTFAAVASLGVDTVETVLAHHIVTDARISFEAAPGADGAVLTTLQGGPVEVDVKGRRHQRVKLIDTDTDDRNPRVIAGDWGGEAVNGYAHGINRVLRPVDLP
ncbi:fasciclin domain-containing protein, partial [Ilumatobacter sp.]|uniref:fasciclin domain-containing protein n=1 Tax=Ilumatobacter sp. TaxID=1967498 RepID=UPI003AF545CE